LPVVNGRKEAGNHPAPSDQKVRRPYPSVTKIIYINRPGGRDGPIGDQPNEKSTHQWAQSTVVALARRGREQRRTPCNAFSATLGGKKLASCAVGIFTRGVLSRHFRELPSGSSPGGVGGVKNCGGQEEIGATRVLRRPLRAVYLERHLRTLLHQPE